MECTEVNKTKMEGKGFCLNAFSFVFAVTGPYIEGLAKALGLDPSSCSVNSKPLADFNKGHPDPNLTYAADFVEQAQKSDWILAAAFDGDGVTNKYSLSIHISFNNNKKKETIFL